MRRWRTVTVVAMVALVGAGLLALRGGATTCPAISFGHKEKIYGISSRDIGGRLSCRTVRAVARESAVRHFAGHVRGWTIVYHRACQCHTASWVNAGHREQFTFNATKRR